MHIYCNFLNDLESFFSRYNIWLFTVWGGTGKVIICSTLSTVGLFSQRIEYQNSSICIDKMEAIDKQSPHHINKTWASSDCEGFGLRFPIFRLVGVQHDAINTNKSFCDEIYGNVHACILWQRQNQVRVSWTFRYWLMDWLIGVLRHVNTR